MSSENQNRKSGNRKLSQTGNIENQEPKMATVTALGIEMTYDDLITKMAETAGTKDGEYWYSVFNSWVDNEYHRVITLDGK